MNTELDEPRLEQLERAIAVLRAFDAEHPRLTVSEVAQLTDSTRASARRILLTFKSLGFMRSDGRHFSLTPRILELGWNYFASLGVDEIAKPLMRDLVDQVDESCSMATLDLPDIVYIARVHTRRVMTIGGGIGSRLPAHATASGLVLLGTLDDDELDKYLTAPLQTYTQHTTTDPEQLKAVVMTARVRGWALNDQALEIGLRGIAVPVHDQSGEVVAALSVSSNSARTTLEDLRDRCLPALQETARAISAGLSRGDAREGLA
ncbi:IclR family transcriptional regulator C-terminal domain-containing protein [Streptomyces sp. NPDC047081]|uniref:IclR family transcriptional regulator domain-containing protein n=1 Tax=Streptomyces sp. NPDC047081 TaxID=3154706 RepID=UPI0033C39677